MISEKAVRMWIDMYLGDADPLDPLASPSYANLEGLPPLYIQTGSCELLLDDARHMAEVARGCGVPVELEVFDGMFHVWQLFFYMLPEGRDAVNKLGNFCRKKIVSSDTTKEQVG